MEHPSSKPPDTEWRCPACGYNLTAPAEPTWMAGIWSGFMGFFGFAALDQRHSSWLIAAGMFLAASTLLLIVWISSAVS
jgi:hypothetical protein